LKPKKSCSVKTKTAFFKGKGGPAWGWRGGRGGGGGGGGHAWAILWHGLAGGGTNPRFGTGKGATRGEVFMKSARAFFVVPSKRGGGATRAGRDDLRHEMGNSPPAGTLLCETRNFYRGIHSQLMGGGIIFSSNSSLPTSLSLITSPSHYSYVGPTPVIDGGEMEGLCAKRERAGASHRGLVEKFPAGLARLLGFVDREGGPSCFLRTVSGRSSRDPGTLNRAPIEKKIRAA